MKRLKPYMAHAILPLFITANFISAFSSISSTPVFADFSSRLIETVNISLDEDKYKSMTAVATAYSSTPDQTDDTPFITALGTRTRDGIIAANFLSFGTKVKIPDLYGDKIFTVEDRMNSRYDKANPPRIDVWMETRGEAIYFGLRRVEIVVLE